MGFAAILIGRGLGLDPLATLAIDPSFGALAMSAVWGALAAGPLFVGLVIVDRQETLLADFKQQISSVVLPLFEGLTLWEIAAISAAAGVGEELAFRGLLQAGLAAWLDHPTGWAWALAAASIAFGVCHWLNVTYAVLAAGIGLYLGVLFLLTGDLAAPVVTHALYDFAAILYLTRGSRRSTNSLPPDEETL